MQRGGVAADGAEDGWGERKKEESTERDERGSKSHVTFRTARTIGEKRRTCATRAARAIRLHYIYPGAAEM